MIRRRAVREPSGSPIVRHGALLLEVVLSLSIFIFVGLAAISLASHALSSMQRAADARTAADIARSVMSRIEAGLIAPEAVSGSVDPTPADGAFETGGEAPRSPWSVAVETRAGPLAELTLITVNVQRQPAPEAQPVTVYTLRQLVRLGSSPRASAAGGSP